MIEKTKCGYLESIIHNLKFNKPAVMIDSLFNRVMIDPFVFLAAP